MFICQSRTPYDQDLLPDLTQAMSEELQLGSDDDEQAIQGKLAKHKRHKAKAQEEAQLEVERQEQAQLEEEKAHAEAEAQRAEAAHKAEEARKVAESWQADALVGSSTGTRTNVEAMSPWEKKKRLRWSSTKVLEGTDDEEEDVGEGPLMKKASVTKAAGAEVETGSVLAMVQKEVLRNFYQFTQSYKTYIEEHFKFLAPDMPSDWDTTNEEDRDIEGLEEGLEGLREEEESWSQSESGDQTSASSAGSQA
ncbi:hypothetical protein F5J12DRAFT_901045 [Pisolithus orientalis]|uniref:uncharacterized protein n=1 Tax=Pisolithus orientalis TaxID=936130 RepID=UPI002224EF6E|nr:uncharacterized protein F5J12DRAFT_901045 [Pisolithus orientalis]KAI5981056.1 hypothetical protein F5J12DRAFT_901045 [Pisolithus orientalis]